MPYLQVDLDGKKKMPACARLAGIPVSQLFWGLLELWEWSLAPGESSLLVTAGYGISASVAAYSPDIELSLSINRTASLGLDIARTASLGLEINRNVSFDESELT